MSIQANLKEVLSELPTGVRLVAVSKFHPNEALSHNPASLTNRCSSSCECMPSL